MQVVASARRVSQVRHQRIGVVLRVMEPLDDDLGGSGPDTVPRDALSSDSPRNLPKAPLVVLGAVLVVLAGSLAGHVVLTDGDQQPVVAASGGVPSRDQGGAGSGDAFARDPASATRSRDVGATVQDAAQDLSTTIRPTTTTRPTTTVERPSHRDLASTVDIISDGFQDDFEGLVNEPEADCMATAVVDTLGLERLWELTEAMAEHTANPGGFSRDDSRLLSGAELEQLNQQMAPCVSEEVAERLDFE